MKRQVRIIRNVFLVGALLFTTLAFASILMKPEPYSSTGALDGDIIRIYGADVWGVRGYFAIHTWVATKAEGEQQFTVQEVIGWKLRRSPTALVTTIGDPDRSWFGNQPTLLHEVTGTKASTLLPKVRDAARTYPYAGTYTMFPGPNSNSFTQWISLAVPELGVQLPLKAIGKNWMTLNYEEHSDALKQNGD